MTFCAIEEKLYLRKNKPELIMQRYHHADIEVGRDFEDAMAESNLFEHARLKVQQEGHRIGEASTDTERKTYFTLLAKYCCDFGVSEESAIRFGVITHWRFRKEAEITIHNGYAEKKDTYGACRTMSKEQRKQFLIDEFLRRNYLLRYNVMTQQTEYANLISYYGPFMPLTDRVRYEMRERMAKEGIPLWDSDLKQRLTSKAVRDFYPMSDFLSRLPKWDKKPRIKKLAMTIPTSLEEWPERFYRWFISMVSHWHHTDPRYGNSIIPVLVGPQGCGKSQFIRSLLPEEMQTYYHDGFDLSHRTDSEEMMTRYGLINIDEFDAITPKQEPVLKHLIQLSEVHINGQPARRFCSFIATSNHYELHRDTSGSRRYVFVDILGEIRLSHRLSLQQIYAEALYAVQHDERTYFTKEEERAMQRDNEEFREQDISEQLFLNYFEPLPFRNSVEGDQWLTAIAIYNTLERLSKKDLGVKRATRFGAILRKHCTKQGSKRGRTSTLYHVRQK